MVYMPPEALDETAQYGPSLDIFSFGHLTLFTLTQVIIISFFSLCDYCYPYHIV